MAIEYLQGEEAEGLAKGDRSRLRVDHDTSAPVLAGEPQRELEDEAQEGGPVSLAVGGLVHREPGQPQHRRGIAREPLSPALPETLELDSTRAGGLDPSDIRVY